MLPRFDIPINADGSASLINYTPIVSIVFLFMFLIAWATYEIIVYSEKRRRDKIIARSEIARTEYYNQQFNKGREL